MRERRIREPGNVATTVIEAVSCPSCGTEVAETPLYRRVRVCPMCQHHFALGAAERIASLVDLGSFEETDAGIVSADPLSFVDRRPYPERLDEARERTGLKEAVVTGTGRIGGRSCALAVLDFSFLGGTMGLAVGEKVTRTLELATTHKLPFIAVCSSGGARMQEGMLSLVQMAKTTAAAARLHEAHVPLITVLTDPTTGGVYASFANQGDIILAEPGALIGFAGPRVIAQTTGEEPPHGTHRAEFLLEHGLIDAIVPRAQLRETLDTLLSRFVGRYPVSRRLTRGTRLLRPIGAVDRAPWEIVGLARHPDRPTARDYIERLFPGFIELHGDRLFGDDPAIISGLAEFGGRPVALIAQERGRSAEHEQRRGGRAYPEGYRKALRILGLAERWGLPVLTFIDTPGAYPGFAAEARGLALALSECLRVMSTVPVPTIATILGEGGSGGALALAVADRVLMLEDAIYSVIAPEGAAAILYRDAGRAAEIASALKLTAQDCLKFGVVDTLVPEPSGGAHRDPDGAAALLRDYLLDALVQVGHLNGGRLVKHRYRKYRRIGRGFIQYTEMAPARRADWHRWDPICTSMGHRLRQLRERAEYLAEHCRDRGIRKAEQV